VKKSICLFCCSLIFFGCTKNKVDNYAKNNSDLGQKIYVITKTDEKINENIYSFEMEPIVESISKLFIYEFPTIIDIDKVPNYTYSISDFSDEEKLFYEKYVGCYIPERELSKEYLSSHLSEVQVNFIENGIVFWGFCKLKAGIRYLEKEKQFFEYETFSGI